MIFFVFNYKFWGTFELKNLLPYQHSWGGTLEPEQIWFPICVAHVGGGGHNHDLGLGSIKTHAKWSLAGPFLCAMSGDALTYKFLTTPIGKLHYRIGLKNSLGTKNCPYKWLWNGHEMVFKFTSIIIEWIKEKNIINCKSQSFSLLSPFFIEVASEWFMKDLGS